MQAPSAAQLVGMWERGARQPWVDRALTLVSACHPELTDSELRALTVGERDADLLALREQIFGRALKSFAECPHCRARLEFSVDVNDLRAGFAGFSNAAARRTDVGRYSRSASAGSTAKIYKPRLGVPTSPMRDGFCCNDAWSMRGATASRWPRPIYRRLASKRSRPDWRRSTARPTLHSICAALPAITPGS